MKKITLKTIIFCNNCNMQFDRMKTIKIKEKTKEARLIEVKEKAHDWKESLRCELCKRCKEKSN